MGSSFAQKCSYQDKKGYLNSVVSKRICSRNLTSHERISPFENGRCRELRMPLVDPLLPFGSRPQTAAMGAERSVTYAPPCFIMLLTRFTRSPTSVTV